MRSLDPPWRLLALLSILILGLAWLVPRLGLHGGQPWAHVGRTVLLAGIAAGLVWRARTLGASTLAWVGWAYVLAAGLSLLLASDVTLFHTSIPSWLALAAPLAGIAWELLIGHRRRA